MNGYVYYHHPSHISRIEKHLEDFKGYTNQQLIDYYNTCCEKGFFGVMEQALRMIALNVTFNRRLGKSPFRITDNVLIEFTNPIVASEGGWAYAE